LNEQTVNTRQTGGSLESLVATLEQKGAAQARVALILGSGLGAFAEELDEARITPFSELPGMPRSAVPGHAGRIVLGTLPGIEPHDEPVKVLVQQGRVHLYEGWTPEETTRSARAFAALGIGVLVLTNAAGGLRRDWSVPTLMRIEDHLNLQGQTALGPLDQAGGSPYAEQLSECLDEAARDTGVVLHSGVYAALSGPTYETPAEIRMLTTIGADAVGMSTAQEACAAHAAGMPVAAISCITNAAAGHSEGPLNHAEVVEAGQQIAADFSRLLTAAVPRLAGRA
jgi:purine-nucleoside phosphorylase